MIDMLILAVHLPGAKIPMVGGIVLTDATTRELTVMFRRDWEQLCDADDAEVLGLMEETLESMARDCEKSGEDLAALLESQLSNTIRCERFSLPSSKSVQELKAILAAGLIER